MWEGGCCEGEGVGDGGDEVEGVSTWHDVEGKQTPAPGCGGGVSENQAS